MLSKFWPFSLFRKKSEVDPLDYVREELESGRLTLEEQDEIDSTDLDLGETQEESVGNNVYELADARSSVDDDVEQSNPPTEEEPPVESVETPEDHEEQSSEKAAQPTEDTLAKDELTEEESAEEPVEETPVEEKSAEEDLQQEAELEFMSDASAAMLLKTPKGGRLLLAFMSLFMVIAVGWAYWAEVDEITRAEGSVIPSSRLQIIQNLEGGILEDLFVTEGEKVRAGQVLIQLDDTKFSSDMRGGQIEYFSELARISRLKAEVNEATPEFSAELDNYSNYVSREKALFESRRAGLMAEEDITRRQTAQSKQELVSIKAQADYLRTSYELGKQELEMTLPLADRGVVSQVELIQLKQRVNDLWGELTMAELSMPKLEQAHEEAKAREREVLLRFKEEALTELNEAEVKIRQVRESQNSLEDQVSRTLVRSPVDGVIKKINVTTIGGVIQPGMDLIEVVPLEDNLMVEARVNPKDIGFLHTGLRAVVKFTAYDFAVYGGLEGTVDHISADTIQDEKGESYYLVRVRTAENYLGTKSKPLEIIPGMRSNIDIMTGKKTIMEYLMKPILRARANALTER